MNLKAFCINLDRRPDRWALAQAEFAKHGLTVERFSAIDGRDIGSHYGNDQDAANAGCTLSHQAIVKQALELNLDAVMVFEDDAQLHDDFNQILRNAMNELPTGWDVLYFGGTHRDAPKPYSNHLLHVRRTLTTHGYIMFRPAFKLMSDVLSVTNEPVDCLFAKLQVLGGCFVTNPPIAWQRAGYSDIVGRDMEYPWIKTNDQ
jgi:glycosyl transferase family 25